MVPAVVETVQLKLRFRSSVQAVSDAMRAVLWLWDMYRVEPTDPELSLGS